MSRIKQHGVHPLERARPFLGFLDDKCCCGYRTSLGFGGQTFVRVSCQLRWVGSQCILEIRCQKYGLIRFVSSSPIIITIKSQQPHPFLLMIITEDDARVVPITHNVCVPHGYVETYISFMWTPLFCRPFAALWGQSYNTFYWFALPNCVCICIHRIAISPMRVPVRWLDGVCVAHASDGGVNSLRAVPRFYTSFTPGRRVAFGRSVEPSSPPHTRAADSTTPTIGSSSHTPGHVANSGRALVPRRPRSTPASTTRRRPSAPPRQLPVCPRRRWKGKASSSRVPFSCFPDLVDPSSVPHSVESQFGSGARVFDDEDANNLL